MNELQLALIGLGAAAVGGVVAYNKWQERRHRQVAEALLTPHRGDALLDEVADEGETYASPPMAEPALAVDLPSFAADPLPATGPISRGVFERAEPPFVEPGLTPEAAPAMAFASAGSERGEARAATAPMAGTPRQEPSLGGLPPIDDIPPFMPAEPVMAPAQAATAPRATVPQTPPSAYVLPPVVSQAPIAAPLLRPDPPRGAIALDDQPEAPLAPPPVNEPARAAVPTSSFSAVLLPPELLSAETDYLVALETLEPLPAYQWVDAQREVLGRLSKAVIWVGFDEREGVWTPLEADDPRPMRRIRVGLQLADRRGPLAEHELAAFHSAMRQVADQFMAVADLPLQRGFLETARELDGFCAQVDIQIGLNVVADQQLFPGTKIRALAESAGMSLEASGAFVRRDDLGRAVYALIGHDPGGFAADTMKTLQSRALTFLLDVPRIAHGDRVFLQVVELARRFADSLHGRVVDDNGQPFTDAMIEPIRRQIVQYQTAMAARGIPAGGPVALRLFA
ncbi:ZipA-like protein [Oryzomicrobium terrae]|uniref:Cell division protein ZipA n=1 Tax=Oryzomicrobium terrae TaxID=1735038 RepID=A0A5C1E961_9RHOO|nr:cell division protein ZipA C-terminal FtsZ-binding domain-containing protein [Oryzomicrobium terrae]QEL65159.1 ZipA-like protein [Oryzomicrobium terrae]